MSRNHPFSLVDAFTTVPLGGNPCSIVFGADSLGSDEMLAIAKEMNQSETAFVLVPLAGGDIKARYFTPEAEIPLAGHPTIATIHAAIERGLLARPPRGSSRDIQLELNDGPIRVQVTSEPEPEREGSALIRMFQRKPVFGMLHEPSEVLPIFGLEPRDLLPGAPIQTVSTGTPQLMIPIASHESLRKVALDPAPYRRYRERTGFFSPHLFCLGGISADAATFARHPGVAPDTAEDAFTGSATGGMAAYLWHHGLIADPRFIAEQGHWMGRPGRAQVEVIGPRDGIESVVVAGTAVTVLRGELSL